MQFPLKPPLRDTVMHKMLQALPMTHVFQYTSNSIQCEAQKISKVRRLRAVSTLKHRKSAKLP